MQRIMGPNSDPFKAVIIRTLPNEPTKVRQKWSGENPPYLTPDATKFLRKFGFAHLLVDTPSVDKEEDEGKLPSHRNFWGLPESSEPPSSDTAPEAPPNSPMSSSTITELCYIPAHIPDGTYILNLQVLENTNLQ
jgi:arylformamidase